MKIVDINGEDVFTFSGMVMSFDDKGNKRLTANYKKSYGDRLIVTLEGMSDCDSMNAVNYIKYSNFKRRYPQHRIYLQGYVTVGE